MKPPDSSGSKQNSKRGVQLPLPLGPAEKDCPRWEGCSAPLCPMSPNLKQAVWFPVEAVCRSELYAGLPWLMTQAEIARLPGKKHRGYFTVAMLRSIREVGPGLTGKKEAEVPERGPGPAARKPARVAAPRRGGAAKGRKKRGTERGKKSVVKKPVVKKPARRTRAVRGTAGAEKVPKKSRPASPSGKGAAGRAKRGGGSRRGEGASPRVAAARPHRARGSVPLGGGESANL
ncbi:MAG: hypothetical protein HY673_05945 [Chloroflexi bacterium]|nr:hypothetical protein [Chloroflexota bacterium]